MSPPGHPRSCMFCGGRPLTKTHIIAGNSIRRHLPRFPGGTIRWDTWGLDVVGARTSEFNVDPADQFVKRACHHCNQAWMGAIEMAVASKVVALALGDCLEIDAQSARDLSLWAVVVALLRSTQDPGEPSVTVDESRSLRDSSSPDGYHVWVVSGSTKQTMASRHMRTVNLSTGEKSHLTWFWLGQAVFLVVRDTAVPFVSGLPIIEKAAIRLWPDSSDPVWPLRRSLSFDTMVQLTDLWE
jgi:hypothetical protein